MTAENPEQPSAAGDKPLYKTGIIAGKPVVRFVSNDTLATAAFTMQDRVVLAATVNTINRLRTEIAELKARLN